MQLVTIVIPIYKEHPSKEELSSLRQVITVLNRYNIVFVVPEPLKTDFYESFCNGIITFRFKRFKAQYFEGIREYNKLMLSLKFYKAFKDFSYILLYQLDAWVFKDQLTEWCDQKYDYIGAPWFSADKPTDGSLPHFMGIGNGGFSLRKVKSHIKVLNRFSYILSPLYFCGQFLKAPTFNGFKILFLKITNENNTHHLLGKNNFNEDVFWGHVARKHKWFKTPSMLEAAKFSMEMCAEKLYCINNNVLPFGCHAWDKYETNFWKNHIQV